MARQPTPIKVVVLRYGFSFGEKHPSPKPGEIITVPHTQVTQLEGQRIVINHARYKKDKAEYDSFIADQRRKAGLDKPQPQPQPEPEAEAEAVEPEPQPEAEQPEAEEKRKPGRPKGNGKGGK